MEKWLSFLFFLIFGILFYIVKGDSVSKLEKRKMVVIVVGIVLLLVVIIGGGFLIFRKTDNPVISDPDIPNEVSPEQAEDIYSNLTKNCSGAMVWDLNLGDSVVIDNIEDYHTSCKTDNYYSKMVGYTYDENDNLILHVNVLKKVENKVYKLDDILIGEYVEENISDLLDNGTTYVYTYNKGADAYKLTKVELMHPIDFEEKNNGENLEDLQE